MIHPWLRHGGLLAVLGSLAGHVSTGERGTARGLSAGERTLPAQERAASFRSASSDLVVLPVVVTDRNGRFVADLPLESFAVYDNARPVPIALFSSQDTPVTIGVIVDTSGSMRPKLRDVVEGMLQLARLSNPHDRLFALRFNDDVMDALPDRPFLLASDLADLEAALGSLVAEGRTALYDALIAGLDRLDRTERPRKALVLISDGGDNASRAKRDMVLERARRSNAAIHTIGIFDPADVDQDPGVLKVLSQATGGSRFLPESPASLRDACAQIAREIRSGYTIGYVPPDRDGTYHRVSVKITGSERRFTVRTRPGYFAATRADANDANGSP
jgi:Ca-activated chloride channel family protein